MHVSSDSGDSKKLPIILYLYKSLFTKYIGSTNHNGMHNMLSRDDTDNKQ